MTDSALPNSAVFHVSALPGPEYSWAVHQGPVKDCERCCHCSNGIAGHIHASQVVPQRAYENSVTYAAVHAAVARIWLGRVEARTVTSPEEHIAAIAHEVMDALEVLHSAAQGRGSASSPSPEG